MSVDSIRQQIAEAVDEVSIVRDRGDNRRYSERIAGALIAAGFIRETDNTGSKLICAPGHYDGDGCTFPTEGHLISVLESAGAPITVEFISHQSGHRGR